MSKIAVIGSGTVARTLAAGFFKHGHEVMIGSRTVSKLDDFTAEYPEIQAGTFSQTAAFGEIVVLAVKGSVALDAVAACGKENLTGKIVIDPTNPIAEAPPENGVLRFFSNLDRSLMEDLQASCPTARFVKAFSMIGSGLMVNPDFGSEKPVMFICGNDQAAKDEVSQILSAFGFEAEDMGQVESARAIEPLCILWCIPGFINGNWNHALRMLKK